MSNSLQPTVAPTPDSGVVNPTAPTQGVNPAQAQMTHAQLPAEVSAIIAAQAAQFQQRINTLMSEKDKSINERNQAISQLTELQKQYTEQQEQTQSSLTAAANSAQQAIDRSTQVDRELAKERARSTKLSALMQRPHLAAYEKLIPEQADEEKLKAVLDELELIREQDLKRYAPAPAVQLQPGQGQQQSQTTASILQGLYGNRANINPAFQQTINPINPASSPAQMNPMAGSTDIVSAINQLYADARKTGTPEAFEDANRRAVLLANSQRPA